MHPKLPEIVTKRTRLITMRISAAGGLLVVHWLVVSSSDVTVKRSTAEQKPDIDSSVSNVPRVF